MQRPDTMKPRLPVLLALLVAIALAAWWARSWRPGLEKSAATPPLVEKLDLEQLRAQAERGDAEAQRKLGLAHATGQGVKQSYAEAARWYRLAAEQGNARAQAALGELYEAGQGVPRDEAEAARWYRRAAEQGDAFAQYSLAVLYLLGKGVPQDRAEAVQWYQRAAAQGHALAQYNLGLRHRDGDGVPRDPVEAYKWLSLAADQGLADAAEARDELQRTLSRQHLKEARQRAQAFAATRLSR